MACQDQFKRTVIRKSRVPSGKMSAAYSTSESARRRRYIRNETVRRRGRIRRSNSCCASRTNKERIGFPSSTLSNSPSTARRSLMRTTRPSISIMDLSHVYFQTSITWRRQSMPRRKEHRSSANACETRGSRHGNGSSTTRIKVWSKPTRSASRTISSPDSMSSST